MDKLDMFKERLQAEMKRQGVSANALSLRAGLGRDAIRNLLSDKASSPTLASALALATALGVKLGALTGDDDTLAHDPEIASLLDAVPADKRDVARTLIRALADSAA